MENKKLNRLLELHYIWQSGIDSGCSDDMTNDIYDEYQVLKKEIEFYLEQV